MSEQKEPVTVFLCGGPACVHDFKGWKPLYDADGQERGGTTVCTKCGRTAFDVAQWEGE